MTSVLIFGSIDLSMGALCSVSNVLYVRIVVLSPNYKAAGWRNTARWPMAWRWWLACWWA